jgi:hypothetical protein
LESYKSPATVNAFLPIEAISTCRSLQAFRELESWWFASITFGFYFFLTASASAELALKIMLPLCSYVETFSKPNDVKAFCSVSFTTVCLPTLISRRKQQIEASKNRF